MKNLKISVVHILGAPKAILLNFFNPDEKCNCCPLIRLHELVIYSVY